MISQKAIKALLDKAARLTEEAGKQYVVMWVGDKARHEIWCEGKSINQ